MVDIQLQRHDQRPQGVARGQAAFAAARFPARRSQSHRQQGRLRRRRMRHLFGVRRWRADEVLPDAGGEGARRADRHHRSRSPNRANCQRAAESLSQGRRQPVRLLHSRHGDGGDRGAARQSVCRPRGDQGAARRQYLPLHRLSENLRRRRAGARRAERPRAGDGAAGDRYRRRRCHRQERPPHRCAEQGVRPR